MPCIRIQNHQIGIAAFQIFPNPVSDRLTIQLSVEKNRTGAYHLAKCFRAADGYDC